MPLGEDDDNTHGRRSPMERPKQVSTSAAASAARRCGDAFTAARWIGVVPAVGT
jgi:hypothetical protein